MVPTQWHRRSGIAGYTDPHANTNRDKYTGFYHTTYSDADEKSATDPNQKSATHSNKETEAIALVLTPPSTKSRGASYVVIYFWNGERDEAYVQLSAAE